MPAAADDFSFSKVTLKDGGGVIFLNEDTKFCFSLVVIKSGGEWLISAPPKSSGTTPFEKDKWIDLFGGNKIRFDGFTGKFPLFSIHKCPPYKFIIQKKRGHGIS